MLADTLYKTKTDKHRFRNETSPPKIKKLSAELMSTYQPTPQKVSEQFATILADNLYKTRTDKNRFRHETSLPKFKKLSTDLISTYMQPPQQVNESFDKQNSILVVSDGGIQVMKRQER